MPARLLFVATSAFVFGIYLLTLPAGVTGGDSGELIASSYTFGSPHPPGYPLFAILGKLASTVPLGTVAWRFNLLTALCGAMAAGLLAVVAARWARSPWAGVAAAGLFAFSPLVWEHATGAEVFALNHLLVAALLLCATSYVHSGERRWSAAGAFVLGLGMANHHTILFLGLPLLGLLAWRERARGFGPRDVARIMAAFSAGLLPYLYLPLASWRPSEVTWGDQRTPGGFLTHILRREYGTFRLGSDGYVRDVGLLDQLASYGQFQLRELLFVGAALAAVGLWSAMRSAPLRPLALWTSGSLLAYLLVFHHLANLPVGEPLFFEVQRRFWQMPHLLFSLWAGVGLATTLSRRRARTWLPLAATVLALAPAGLHYHAQDRTASDEFLRYAAALLEPLPPDALVLARGDLIVNTAQYAQVAGGLRPDVQVLDLERLTYPWMRRVMERHAPEVHLPGERLGSGRGGSFTLPELVEANAGARRIFLAGNLHPAEAAAFERYELWPFGMARELVPATARSDVELRVIEGARALPALPTVEGPPAPRGSWSWVVRRDLWEAHHRHAVKLLEIGIDLDDPAWLRRAAERLEALASAGPEADPLVYRNLGLAYARLASFDPAYAALTRAAWERYLRESAPDDPGRRAIDEALGR